MSMNSIPVDSAVALFCALHLPTDSIPHCLTVIDQLELSLQQAKPAPPNLEGLLTNLTKLRLLITAGQRSTQAETSLKLSIDQVLLAPSKQT
jgi:hypothetical protein